ncbi:MAG: aconitase/3-isopropylmalate dehydratase large subunit family protein [Actinomycetota bacterium]|nr:aconitase/3-isopropylmalate dehydratase large subunit family protein [Actinomycetota bacterium]
MTAKGQVAVTVGEDRHPPREMASADMTAAEAILARAAGAARVEPGEYVVAEIDAMMMHDIFAADVLGLLERVGIASLHDPSRATVVFDHMVPAPSVAAAEHQAAARRLVRHYGIDAFFEIGRGICHQVMVEESRVGSGDLVVGTDSHTTTYGALGAAGCGIGTSEMAYALATGKLWFKVPETVLVVLEGRLNPMVSAKDLVLFEMREIGSREAQYRSVEHAGSGTATLSLAERMTVANMGVEMGAKFSLFPSERTPTMRPGAGYATRHSIDLDALSPQVAVPHHVENVVDVDDVVGLHLDQVFLGSCTNGRLEDLHQAANILRGRTIARGLRMIVTPASSLVFRQAAEDGTLAVLAAAGAIVEGPGCGPCFGGHLGLLAPGERCLGTHNRNFKGRMGSPGAEIYLGSPATAAVSALVGAIADPRELVVERVGQEAGR